MEASFVIPLLLYFSVERALVEPGFNEKHEGQPDAGRS
jgi:hypothetical protein